MKYLKQFLIILGVSFFGELLSFILPFPVPASIYGLIIMLLLLCLKIVTPKKISETTNFLLDTMPVMFVPAGVGIMVSWKILYPIFIPTLIIATVTTVIIMGVSGKVTQFIIRYGRKDNA